MLFSAQYSLWSIILKSPHHNTYRYQRNGFMFGTFAHIVFVYLFWSSCSALLMEQFFGNLWLSLLLYFVSCQLLSLYNPLEPLKVFPQFVIVSLYVLPDALLELLGDIDFGVNLISVGIYIHLGVGADISVFIHLLLFDGHKPLVPSFLFID